MTRIVKIFARIYLYLPKNDKNKKDIRKKYPL